MATAERKKQEKTAKNTAARKQVELRRIERDRRLQRVETPDTDG